MRLYKLTDNKDKTRSLQWGENVTHSASGEGDRLCSDGVIHCYTSPLLAVLMDPVHADYLAGGGHLWLAEGGVIVSDGLKAGCKTLTTLRRIDAPVITATQRTAFGILCAKAVCDATNWNAWADRWLSGEGRSEAAARAEEAARAAAWAAEAEAAWAAEAEAAWGLDFHAIAQQAMKY